MQIIHAYNGEAILVDDCNYNDLIHFQWRAKLMRPGLIYALTSNQGWGRWSTTTTATA
jgi:hypothetical protein